MVQLRTFGCLSADQLYSSKKSGFGEVQEVPIRVKHEDEEGGEGEGQRAIPRGRSLLPHLTVRRASDLIHSKVNNDFYQI